MTLVELDLVGHQTGAKALVGRVLHVPARHRLLHKLPKRLLFGSVSILDDAPDLEVLGGIAALVLGGTLPGAQIGALGRECQLVDRGQLGQRRQDVADRGIDNGDAGIAGVGEVAAARRVDTTPEIPLGLDEPWEALVDRSGIDDADGLLGPEGKLQWAGHD